VDRHRPNVLAVDGIPSDLELLLVAHMDTAPPSAGWTVPEFSVRDGHYYALGASDAKAGIAAILTAAKNVGKTKGVGYLFYVDQEQGVNGMRDFVRRHPSLRPKMVLSVCGAGAKMLAGCRGYIRLSFILRGHSSHSSRAKLGSNAIDAIYAITQALKDWCEKQEGPYETMCTIVSIHGGTAMSDILPEEKEEMPPHETVPRMMEFSSRVPDLAWALLDIRPGNPHVDVDHVKKNMEEALAAWNTQNNVPDKYVKLARFFVHLETKGFSSPEGSYQPIVEDLAPVHGREFADASMHGYVDIAMIAERNPQSGVVALAPKKGNENAPDEWVEIENLQTYRDSLIKLLSRYKI
jgi:acetylornithine deacetylase/succinyl-diaminopimelate desuccinylase-like protein